MIFILLHPSETLLPTNLHAHTQTLTQMNAHSNTHRRTLARPGRCAVLLSHNCDSIKLVVKTTRPPNQLHSLSLLFHLPFTLSHLCLPFFSNFFSYVTVYFFSHPFNQCFSIFFLPFISLLFHGSSQFLSALYFTHSQENTNMDFVPFVIFHSYFQFRSPFQVPFCCFSSLFAFCSSYFIILYLFLLNMSIPFYSPVCTNLLLSFNFSLLFSPLRLPLLPM